MSSDGLTIYAATDLQAIWKSTDGGNTFAATNSGNKAWQDIVCSSSGAIVYGALYNGLIWKSTDSGSNWAALANSPTKNLENNSI